MCTLVVNSIDSIPLVERSTQRHGGIRQRQADSHTAGPSRRDHRFGVLQKRTIYRQNEKTRKQDCAIFFIYFYTIVDVRLSLFLWICTQTGGAYALLNHLKATSIRLHFSCSHFCVLPSRVRCSTLAKTRAVALLCFASLPNRV